MKKIYRFVFAAALVLLFAGVFTGAVAAADASAAGPTDNATVFTGNADNADDLGFSQFHRTDEQYSPEQVALRAALRNYHRAMGMYNTAKQEFENANKAYEDAIRSGDESKKRAALGDLQRKKSTLTLTEKAMLAAKERYEEAGGGGKGRHWPAPR